VFNRASLPANKCERFRSISDVPDAQLFKSKIADFSILRYLREYQSVSITLETKTSSCGRDMYKTGIVNKLELS